MTMGPGVRTEGVVIVGLDTGNPGGRGHLYPPSSWRRLGWAAGAGNSEKGGTASKAAGPTFGAGVLDRSKTDSGRRPVAPPSGRPDNGRRPVAPPSGRPDNFVFSSAVCEDWAGAQLAYFYSKFEEPTWTARGHHQSSRRWRGGYCRRCLTKILLSSPGVGSTTTVHDQSTAAVEEGALGYANLWHYLLRGADDDRKTQKPGPQKTMKKESDDDSNRDPWDGGATPRRQEDPSSVGKTGGSGDSIGTTTTPSDVFSTEQSGTGTTEWSSSSPAGAESSDSEPSEFGPPPPSAASGPTGPNLPTSSTSSRGGSSGADPVVAFLERLLLAGPPPVLPVSGGAGKSAEVLPVSGGGAGLLPPTTNRRETEEGPSDDEPEGN